MRFPLALACLHWHLDHMTFPLAGSGHRSRESISGVPLRHRSLRPRLGFGPQIRCCVHQLHRCGLGISTRSGATEHRAHTKEWTLRTLLVLKGNKGEFVFYMCSFLCGWVGHMMECAAVTPRQMQARSATMTALLHFFPSMYSWRCTNIAVCRYHGESGERTGSSISRTSV